MTDKERPSKAPWEIPENWSSRDFKDLATGLETEESVYLPDNIRRLEQRYGLDAKRVLWRFVPKVGNLDFTLALSLTGWQSDPNLEFYTLHKANGSNRPVEHDGITKQAIFLDHPQQDAVEIDWINYLAPPQTVSMRGNFARAKYSPAGLLDELILQAEPPHLIRERSLGEKVTFEEFQQEPAKRINHINEYVNYIKTATEDVDDYTNWSKSDREERLPGGYRYIVEHMFGGNYDNPEVIKANELAQRLFAHMLGLMPGDDWDEFSRLYQERYLQQQFAGAILQMADKVNPGGLSTEQLDMDKLVYQVISREIMLMEASRRSRYKPLIVTISLSDFTEDGFNACERQQEVWFGGVAASAYVAQWLGAPTEQVGSVAQFKYGEPIASQDKTFTVKRDGRILEAASCGWRGKKPLWRSYLPNQIDVQGIKEFYEDESSDFRKIRALLGIDFQRE